MNPKHTALITGASSGIGKVFAYRFAQAGYDLILTGRRKDKLHAVAGDLSEKYNVTIDVVFAELSKAKDVGSLIKIIEKRDNIDVLINNAGYGSGKEFSGNKLSNHLQMIQVQAVTVIRLVHAVLPQMISRKKGTIINVSSMSAFTPAPYGSIYSATKLFLKSFSQSLHMEMEQYGIKVMCLCPGFTHTDFHERFTSAFIPKKYGIIRWMEADVVVDKCLKALEQGKIIYIPGFMNRILVRVVQLLPHVTYYKLMMKFSKRPVRTNQIRKERSGKIEPAF